MPTAFGAVDRNLKFRLFYNNSHKACQSLFTTPAPNLKSYMKPCWGMCYWKCFTSLKIFFSTRSERNPKTYLFLFSLTQLSICKRRQRGRGPRLAIVDKVRRSDVNVRLQSWGYWRKSKKPSSPHHELGTQWGAYASTTGFDKTW